MTSAMDQSSLMTSRQFLFGLANNLHDAIEGEDLFVGHDCQCSQRQEIQDVDSVAASSDYGETIKGNVPNLKGASGGGTPIKRGADAEFVDHRRRAGYRDLPRLCVQGICSRRPAFIRLASLSSPALCGLKPT